VTPAEEAAALRVLDVGLTRCHPDLAQAFARWQPPVRGIRGRARRLRALGPGTCTVLFLLCLSLVWLYLAEIWACL
jgi:hypothetical protein